MSRVDNETEICSACGEDEALSQFLEHYLAPMSVWPVVRRYNITFPPEAQEELERLVEEHSNAQRLGE